MEREGKALEDGRTYIGWDQLGDISNIESREENVRLWTGEDLVSELQDIYDKLPEDWQTEIPLQRIWTLVDSHE